MPSNGEYMQKRIVGYDIMKSLSIYLVVLIHFGFYVPVTGDTLVNNFVLILTNVGVPLFFMVNGALLFPRSLDIKRHYIKTARIIALTLSWKVISAFIMGCIVHRNPFHLGKAAFVHYLLFGNLEGFDLGHFWFMNVLIMLYLIFPILKICFDSEMGREALRCLLVIILCFTVGASAFDILAAAASHFLGITPFSITGDLSQINPFGTYGYTLLYFIGGGLLSREGLGTLIRDGANKAPSRLALSISFALGWLLLLLTWWFQRLSQSSPFTVVGGYWNIATVVMSFSLFGCCTSLKCQSKNLCAIFKVIGDNTLGIYFTHMFALVSLYRLIASSDFASVFDMKLPLPIDLGLVMLICLACLLVSIFFRKVPLLRALFKL